MEPINYHFSTLIMAVFNGMILGLWYDIYRLCKGVFRFRGLVLACGDFFFWFISTLITVVLIFISSWGDVRLYVFIAMLIGAWFYFTAFSQLVLNLLLKPVKMLQQAFYRPKFPKTKGRFFCL